MTWFLTLARDSYSGFVALFPRLLVPLIAMLGWDIVLRWSRLLPAEVQFDPGFLGSTLRVSIFLLGILGSAAFMLWVHRLIATPDAPARAIFSLRGFPRYLGLYLLAFLIPGLGGLIVFGGVAPLPHSLFAMVNILNQGDVPKSLYPFLWGAGLSGLSYILFLWMLPALHRVATEPDIPIKQALKDAKQAPSMAKALGLWLAWALLPMPFLIIGRLWAFIDVGLFGPLSDVFGVPVAQAVGDVLFRLHHSFSDMALALVAVIAASLAKDLSTRDPS